MRLREFPPTASRAAGYQLDRVQRGLDRVAVLHAFQKKTQRTAKRDIDLAARRFRELHKD